MRPRSLLPLFALVSACSSDLPVEAPLFHPGSVAARVSESDDAMMALGTAINASLANSDADYRLASIAWLSGDGAGSELRFFDVGNKKLPHDFVPADPRRGSRTNITYIVDEADGAVDGLAASQTTAAIDRAMSAWNAISCSVIPVTRLAPSATDLGVLEFLLGLGGSPESVADITHAGWLPAGVVPTEVIGVTFTFLFGSTAPTDIDNNGYADVAFREIMYNDAYPWFVDGLRHIDVETVALHEAGHGLSQDHFGQLFRTTANGKFHFAPLAVMNAGYKGIHRQLEATDNAGYCANWANWPNN